MRLISPQEIQPVVRIANDHAVLAGQSWSKRSIPDLQIILVIAGNFEYCQDEQRCSLQPGNVLFIEPGIEHTFRSIESENVGRISGIHLELLPDGSWVAGDYRLEPAPDRITSVLDVPRGN